MDNQNKLKIVDLKNITKRFVLSGQSIPVLNGISLTFTSGEFAAIVGPSGNGKSTLLNMISGIDRPTTGEVIVNNQNLSNLNEDQLSGWRGKNLGIVFQFFQLLPALSLLQNVILPMDFIGQLRPKERHERAKNLLSMVGLQDQMHKLPGLVSGGQQQRAAIARALANDPPLIIADEPTGNLDVKTSEEVFGIFLELSKQGKTVLMVTHNEDLACRATRRVEVINGIITFDGSCA